MRYFRFANGCSTMERREPHHFPRGPQLHTLQRIVVQVASDGAPRTRRASRFQRAGSAHFRLTGVVHRAIFPR